MSKVEVYKYVEKINKIYSTWSYLFNKMNAEQRNDEIAKILNEYVEAVNSPIGKTCMMCKNPKENDGHTCCEECAGVAF